MYPDHFVRQELIMWMLHTQRSPQTKIGPLDGAPIGLTQEKLNV